MSIQCLLCDQRDAGHHYGCHQCVTGIQRQLRELDSYVEVLALIAAPTRGNQGTRSPGYGSRPPARDDVITALDSRSGAGAAVHRLRDPRDMDDEPIRSIPGSLHGIACWLREQHELTNPPHWTVTSEVAFILGKVEWAACFDWVTELADDIHELWTQARALAHDQPPRALGDCLGVDCDGKVYPAQIRDNEGRHDGARCATCRREYAGLDLVRLSVAQEAS